VLTKIKKYAGIICGAIALAGGFILGILCGSKRSRIDPTGGSDSRRTAGDIIRERELEQRIQRTESEISIELDNASAELNEASARNSAVENRKRNTARIIRDVKRRNNLE
jgi:anti-sigma-K factor RskA